MNDIPSRNVPLPTPPRLNVYLPFGLFFLSGFCGILYQVVWLRLAFAAFGVITPVLSLTISTFMLGLAVGTWAAGRWIEPLARRTRTSAIFYYGMAEFLIGLGAFLVPRTFAWGQNYLNAFGSMDSGTYLLRSALIIGLALLPWCLLMGATFPLMLSFLREESASTENNFSFLYLANVIGAMVGAISTAAVLVELLGFRSTLLVGACANFLVAAVSVAVGVRFGRRPAEARPASSPSPARPELKETLSSPAFILGVLFTTGCVSIALEVVWTRAFTPVLETTIYSFALLLAVYLLATWVGSSWYRADLARGKPHTNQSLLALLALTSLLPVLASDPRLHASARLLLASIFPCCAVLGYLTPKLIDQYSLGMPHVAGKAYALNIVGCILGPLLAGYVLLPFLGVRYAMILLAVPFFLYYAAAYRVGGRGVHRHPAFAAVAAVLLIVSLFVSRSYEDGGFYENDQVRRDYVATVIAYGEGRTKGMLVNGVGITSLTPITKIMAHLPLAMRERKPESALVICFGMGTTFRSLMSWDIEVTAVELVPSVVHAFPFYFADAPALMSSPKADIVIDDGRRYLNRTGKTFDVVTIDPPPPPEAAGSSLLYSREFYQAVKRRLKPDGIVQQWFPGGSERSTFQAVLRSIRSEFPYVKVFHSVEGWGWHMLASRTPLHTPAPDEFLARLPQKAEADLVEWFPERTVQELSAQILRQEKQIGGLFRFSRNQSLVTDDLPYNEYFYLRRR